MKLVVENEKIRIPTASRNGIKVQPFSRKTEAVKPTDQQTFAGAPLCWKTQLTGTFISICNCMTVPSTCWRYLQYVDLIHKSMKIQEQRTGAYGTEVHTTSCGKCIPFGTKAPIH